MTEGLGRGSALKMAKPWSSLGELDALGIRLYN
jgi:hypothetical protein